MSVSVLKECGKVLVIVLCCVEGVLTDVGHCALLLKEC